MTTSQSTFFLRVWQAQERPPSVGMPVSNGPRETLFQEFEFVIHLSLADPDIQSAASFEDLIPHPSAEVRKAVAEAIIERRGKKCLFVMDGWEDLAPTVQASSFLRSIIQRNAPGVSLPLCSFLVTSRPVASSSLVSCISSTISVEAFSADMMSLPIPLSTSPHKWNLRSFCPQLRPGHLHIAFVVFPSTWSP